MKSCFLMMSLLLVSFLASTSSGEELSVQGIDICCQQCEQDLKNASNQVDGVESVMLDRGSKSVAYKVDNDDAAANVITALAKAGFQGRIKYSGIRRLEFPESGAKRNETGDDITITSIHLCCEKCQKEADRALKRVVGVSEVVIDAEKDTVIVLGVDITVLELVKSLNRLGLHAKVDF